MFEAGPCLTLESMPRFTTTSAIGGQSWAMNNKGLTVFDFGVN
jgi:hypothetical protein